jgi:hypothetical protein
MRVTYPLKTHVRCGLVQVPCVGIRFRELHGRMQNTSFLVRVRLRVGCWVEERVNRDEVMGAVQRVLHGMSSEDTRLSKRQTRSFLFVFLLNDLLYLSCLLLCRVLLFFFLFSCDVLLPSLSCLVSLHPVAWFTFCWVVLC